MKIYTRTGDAGETALFGGGRVSKDHPRVAAYGDVDELNSAIGVVRAMPPHAFHDQLLESIQRDLFAIGGHLATPDPEFLAAWQGAWSDAELPAILWLTHPSAQNMSPYAGRETVFHSRMLDALSALRKTAREVLGWTPPRERPHPPTDGIYALAEWRELIAPRNYDLDELWRAKGV